MEIWKLDKAKDHNSSSILLIKVFYRFDIWYLLFITP